MTDTIEALRGCRVAYEFTQNNPAPPDKVFPLLCPVRESDWLPGWNYQIIYSDSGVAELGCIFTTINSSVQPPAQVTWTTIDYDPVAYRIAYVWINPGRVLAELRIQLSKAEDGSTRNHIRYRYTGLSPDGNREVEGYDREWFAKRMLNWETAINHYLRTGTKIAQLAAPGK